MVAVAAAKFETLASAKNTLAPLRVRDSKIKTKKICQKNKNQYLNTMSEKQIIENLVKELVAEKSYHPRRKGDFDAGWACGALRALEHVLEAIGSEKSISVTDDGVVFE